MHEKATLAPHRFRFTHEPDAKAYGNPDDPDGWWLYDEEALTALPFNTLIEVEAHITPVTMLMAMQGVRDQSILGMHVATWIVIHLANPNIAGPYLQYDPRDLLIEWQDAPTGAGAADPLDSATSPDSSPGESPTPTTASKRRSPTKRTSRPRR